MWWNEISWFFFLLFFTFDDVDIKIRSYFLTFVACTRSFDLDHSKIHTHTYFGQLANTEFIFYFHFLFSFVFNGKKNQNTNEREGVEKKAQNFVVKIFKIDKYLNTRPWITQNKKLNSNFLTKVSFIFQLKSFFISLLLTQQIL